MLNGHSRTEFLRSIDYAEGEIAQDWQMFKETFARVAEAIKYRHLYVKALREIGPSRVPLPELLRQKQEIEATYKFIHDCLGPALEPLLWPSLQRPPEVQAEIDRLDRDTFETVCGMLRKLGIE